MLLLLVLLLLFHYLLLIFIYNVLLLGANAFNGDPFTCINNWNPTTTRTIDSTALTTAQKTTCTCVDGSYAVNYICTSCDIGYYCSGGSRTECPNGKTTPSTGSSLISQCTISTPTFAPTFAPTFVPTFVPTILTGYYYYYIYYSIINILIFILLIQ